MAFRPSASSSYSRHPSKQAFPPPQTPAVYRKIAYSFLALTVIVALGVLWLSSVHARVTVKVKGDSAVLQAPVEIAKSPEQGQLKGRVVSGTFDKIQEFSVKDGGTTTEVPADTVVRGTVKIVNNYSREQTLIKTTRLLTSDGRLYRIDKTVVIPVKGTVTVPAYSDQKGSKYVMDAGVRMSIPGLWPDLQKWIYAESVSGFSGGGTQTDKVVSSLDVSEAQKALEDAVYEQAVKTLTAEAGMTDAKGIFTKKVLEKKTNVTPGQSSDQFLASIKLEVTGVFFAPAEMDAYVKNKLKDSLRDGREITGFDPGQVTYTLERADPSLEKAKINISAQASAKLTEKSPVLSKDMIAGKGIEEAKTKLSSIDGVESVDIKVSPVWIHKLPSLTDHIEIVIK